MDDSLCSRELMFGLPPASAAIPDEAADESDDDAIVVATEVYNPSEAELVCALLTAHDIPCLLKAENQYAVDATYTVGPLARRRILVRAKDLACAKEILAASPEPDGEAREDGEPNWAS